jgi:hypothetical protein
MTSWHVDEPGDQAPGPVDLDMVWSRTRDAIELPRPALFERLLRRCGLTAQDARLVAAATALRRAWLAGAAAVLGFVTLAGVVGHSAGLWVFLAVAPLVPCVAVAVSYAPEMDPALEPELVTPYPAFRLIVLRTVAVLALTLPVVVLLGSLVPGQAPLWWLLPAVGFVAAVLAASTWTSPLRAAIVVSAAWLVGVTLLVERSGSPDELARARLQVCIAALAAAAALIFLLRRGRLRELRPRR